MQHVLVETCRCSCVFWRQVLRSECDNTFYSSCLLITLPSSGVSKKERKKAFSGNNKNNKTYLIHPTEHALCARTHHSKHSNVRVCVRIQYSWHSTHALFCSVYMTSLANTFMQWAHIVSNTLQVERFHSIKTRAYTYNGAEQSEEKKNCRQNCFTHRIQSDLLAF